MDLRSLFSFFFFNDTATTEIYTLSLHDALPILTVLAIHRGEQTLNPGPDVALREGDLLIVKARREALIEVKQTEGMEIVPDLHVGDRDLAGGALKIAEAIIMPQSLLIGRSLRDLNFRHRFGLTVIALHRRRHAIPTKNGSLPLPVGQLL